MAARRIAGEMEASEELVRSQRRCKKIRRSDSFEVPDDRECSPASVGQSGQSSSTVGQWQFQAACRAAGDVLLWYRNVRRQAALLCCELHMLDKAAHVLLAIEVLDNLLRLKAA